MAAHLINTARALDDIRFRWRVRAAALRTATIRKDSQLPEEVKYSEYLLQNPMIEVPQFESLCAVDIGVVDKVLVDQFNAVNTEAVSDDTILYVVEVNFTWMATQFATGDTVRTGSIPTGWAQ